MMGTADELAIAVLGRQVPPDLLHGGGELHVVVGIGGEDFQGSGALVGGHVVNVPRDVCRWATIAHTATGAELGTLREEAIAVGLREQLNHGLLGTHCGRERAIRRDSKRVTWALLTCHDQINGASELLSLDAQTALHLTIVAGLHPLDADTALAAIESSAVVLEAWCLAP